MKIHTFEITKSPGQSGSGNLYSAKYSDDSSADNVAENQKEE